MKCWTSSSTGSAEPGTTMRVTSNSFPNNLISQLQRVTGRVATLQNQAATGQRITQPSDDPAAAVRVLSFQSERSRIAQYQQNAQRAQDVVNATVAQVRNMVSVSDRAGEIVTLSSDVLGPDALKIYGIEVNQLIEQTLASANTDFNDEPLFGGTTANTPFLEVRDANGNITSVAYNGSATAASVQISEGSTLSPYTDAATNGQIEDFLNRLVSLRDALQSGVSANVKLQATNLKGSEDNLIDLLSGRGALQQRLEIETKQNNSRYSDLAVQVSRDADADLAQTIVDLTQNQNAYQAALMSAGKILNKSLLDFIV
jgi:flagellar hook-associated protein 3 FlgL